MHGDVAGARLVAHGHEERAFRSGISELFQLGFEVFDLVDHRRARNLFFLGLPNVRCRRRHGGGFRRRGGIDGNEHHGIGDDDAFRAFVTDDDEASAILLETMLTQRNEVAVERRHFLLVNVDRLLAISAKNGDGRVRRAVSSGDVAEAHFVKPSLRKLGLEGERLLAFAGVGVVQITLANETAVEL